MRPARGLPVTAIRGSAMEAALRVAALPAGLLDEFVGMACEVGREPEADKLAGALRQRAGALPEIVEHYLRGLEDLR
jgi:hypothetical protein